MKTSKIKQKSNIFSESYSKVLAIDPGISGGLAAFTKDTVTAILMPTKTVKGWKVDAGKTVQTTEKVIDSKAVLEFVQQINPEILCIEMVKYWGSDAKQGILTTGKRFGVLQSIATFLDIPIIEVYSKTWQKIVLGKEDKDKEIAIAYVKANYPHIDLQPGRCRTDQDGIADAVCIGVFGQKWCCQADLTVIPV